MRVVFRVDAAAEIGTGHIMRCLTLADGLRFAGAEVEFVCRQLDEGLRSRLREQGHALTMLETVAASMSDGDRQLMHSHWLSVSQAEDARDTLLALGDRPCDWMIVDHYALNVRWEHAVRVKARRIMVIDDLADRHHDCDLLLDQNLVEGMNTRYADKVPAACKTLLGPHYALLQPLYATLRERVAARRLPVRRIFVYFGGTDRFNLTAHALSALARLDLPHCEVDAVLPAGADSALALSAAGASPVPVRLHQGLKTLADFMAQADLAIGACGATSWERICLGLPSIVTSLAVNQEPVAAYLHRAGLVHWVGPAESVDERVLGTAIEGVLRGSAFAKWSQHCFAACDGYGTPRTIDNMIALQRSAADTLQVQ